MKIQFIVVLFLLLNATFIISNDDLALKDFQNVKEFFSLYSEWFKEIGKNIGQITGNALSLDWIPKNTIE